MTVGIPRQLHRHAVATAAEHVAARLQQDVVLAGVRTQADRTPIGVDDDVERLDVRRGLVRLDVGEVPPAQRTRRASELFGADALAVVAEDGVPPGGHG